MRADGGPPMPVSPGECYRIPGCGPGRGRVMCATELKGDRKQPTIAAHPKDPVMTLRTIPRRFPRLLASLGFVLLSGFAGQASAQVTLGTAQTYGVLGGSTVTNTGPTVIDGDLGVSPGSAVVGFPPGIVTGTTNVANAAALQAQNDTTTAYNFLAGQACGATLSGDLGGRTLTPGVYCFASTAQLTGTLTLDAQGNPNSVFIFQIGSALTTASGASVVLANSGNACNVWWQVGSSATLGTTTSFMGTIIALTSITLNTGATATGRMLARNGAVTLDTNTVSVPACPATPACPVISLAPTTLPAGSVGATYSQVVSGSGTAASPVTFSITGGALPAGLSLNGATGAITGTPTAAGVFNVTVTATDANACSANRQYALTIAAAAVTGGPRQVPTLSEWAMILLAGLVAIAGFLVMRRKGY